MSFKHLQIDAPKPWPHSAWYQAAWSHELKDEPLARTLLNEQVVLFRGKDGRAHALEDRCCHRFTPLSLGEVVAGGLQCGYHGMVFNGAGKCVEIPGQDSIPPQAQVRSYPIVERQEIVWIWMGDPARANDELIIDFPYLDDHENHPHGHGLLEIDCNYMLLVDNLMDMTHIPYIHKKTIGGGDQKSQVNAPIDVTRKDTGVHYIRWMENIEPPPTYRKAAGWGDDVRVDRWQEFEYVAPATVLQWSGALESGRGARQDRFQQGGFSARVWHTATPRTETSCYYFWAALNSFLPKDKAATEKLHSEVAKTFDEDIIFLERQQACLSAYPDKGSVDIKHDAARKPARATLERMIRADAEALATSVQ